MQTFRPNRREFLQIVAGSLATADVPAYLLAGQTQPITGFQNLREYAIKLYDETDSFNYIRDGQGNLRPRPGQEMSVPSLLQGEVDGKRTRVIVHKDLPSGPYSLETKTYFNRKDVPFGGTLELDNFAGLFLFPNFASNVFLDKGIKGNVQGRTDAVTAVSMNPKSVKYSMFTGDGGYYFAHFQVPRNIDDQSLRERVQNLVRSVEGLGFSERDTTNLLGNLASFDMPSIEYGSHRLSNEPGIHIRNLFLILLDGVAWYSPTGVVQSYWDLSLGNSRGVNVGTQPRLIGSYSGSSHAELQRRREEAFDSANRENTRIMHRTLDTLVEEGKIILPQNL